MELQEFKEDFAQEFIRNAAKEACSSLLPQKSKDRYEKTYKQFCDWRKKNKVEASDETIMLAYFFEKVKNKNHLLIYFTYFYSLL